MSIKTSISLASNTLKAVDALAKARESNRSRIIEEAIQDYLVRRRRDARDRRELAILNRHARELNREMADVLEVQRLP